MGGGDQRSYVKAAKQEGLKHYRFIGDSCLCVLNPSGNIPAQDTDDSTLLGPYPQEATHAPQVGVPRRPVCGRGFSPTPVCHPIFFFLFLAQPEPHGGVSGSGGVLPVVRVRRGVLRNDAERFQRQRLAEERSTGHVRFHHSSTGHGDQGRRCDPR